MSSLETAFTRHAGVEVPLICGAMYPCSNPELIAAWHAERMRRLSQQSRPRRDPMRPDDRRWG